MLFFWGMIYGTIVFGVYLATGGDFNELRAGNVAFPDWMWASLLLSPMDMSQMGAMISFGISSILGFDMTMPGFMNIWVILAAHFVWIAVALTLAFHFFKKRDI